VEIGGLMCRLPLQATLTGLMRSRAAGESVLGDRLRDRLMAELPAGEADGGSSPEELFEAWAANTNYCYRLAEGWTTEVLGSVAAKAVGGRIDRRTLSDEERELLTAYVGAQENWQSVCLVLGTSGPSSGRVATEAVTINRPLARSVDSRELAEALLNGQDGSGQTAFDGAAIKRCIRAFGGQAAVYNGGPQRRASPAILLHGLEGLEGAEEVAPGTKIYRGGVMDAIDGVLDGRFSPLDFRWFIGRLGGLRVDGFEWQAVACARPVALKQCLGLPKPLWHEVMELCGGQSAELSRLEILKREDIEPDDDPDDPESRRG